MFCCRRLFCFLGARQGTIARPCFRSRPSLPTLDILTRQFPGHRASLKRTILATALACFNDHGLEATTIEMIRERCDTSVGNIYHHFGNKDGLIAALFLCALEDQAQLLADYLARARTAREGVAALVHSYVDWVSAQPEFARFQFMARTAVASGPRARARGKEPRTQPPRARLVRACAATRRDGAVARRAAAFADRRSIGKLLPRVAERPGQGAARQVSGRTRDGGVAIGFEVAAADASPRASIGRRAPSARRLRARTSAGLVREETMPAHPGRFEPDAGCPHGAETPRATG